VKQQSRPLLEFEDLTLIGGKVTLFEGLTLTLDPGEACVVEGANRSGKTSLLAALERRTERELVLRGAVRFSGQSVLELPEDAYRRTFSDRVAWIHEDGGATLFPSRRVRSLFRKAGESPSELLAALGFAAPEVTLRQRVRELSHGARLSVSLAVALSHLAPREGPAPQAPQAASPAQLLIIDDIFHSCDALRTDQWLSLLRRRIDDRGLAVLVMCRSAESCGALLPDQVVSLPNARPLAPPRPFQPVGWGVETPAAQDLRGGKPLLQVRHLTTLRSRDMGWIAKPAPVFALQSVSLELQRGEALGIVGASPSGKSTLALTLARIVEPSFGQVSVRTRGERSEGPGPQRMMLCFEDARPSFDPRLTLGRQLRQAVELRPKGTDAQELEVRALGAVGLEPELLRRRPNEVSQAEVQLTAFTRALLLDPSVLILDNALSNVEAEHRLRLLTLLRDRCRTRGLGALVVTHRLASLALVFDRVGVMYAGHLVEIGPTDEVISQRHHPYTRVLLDTQPHPKRRLQMIAEGTSPDLTRPPTGCVYHPRCPNAETGRCDVEAPDLLPIGSGAGHQVACWHPHV